MNSNEYSHDKLVGDRFEEVDYIPEEHNEEALVALNSIIEQNQYVVLGTKIATVYDRKGFMSHDSITRKRNESYSSENDDIILQITVRIDGRDVRTKSGAGKEVSELIGSVRNSHLEAEILKGEKDLMHAVEHFEQAKEALKKKRADLESLKASQSWVDKKL